MDLSNEFRRAKGVHIMTTNVFNYYIGNYPTKDKVLSIKELSETYIKKFKSVTIRELYSKMVGFEDEELQDMVLATYDVYVDLLSACDWILETNQYVSGSSQKFNFPDVLIDIDYFHKDEDEDLHVVDYVRMYNRTNGELLLDTEEIQVYDKNIKPTQTYESVKVDKIDFHKRQIYFLPL